MTRKRHPVGIKNDANAFFIEAPTVSIENHRWNITCAYVYMYIYIRRVKALGKALLIEPRFHVPLSSGKLEQTEDQGA